MGKSKRITAELTDSDVLSIPFTKICNDNETTIRYVYHISDIHIRTTKRHQEYLEVFERLYAQLRETSNAESIIVLTGDIMHAKTELSPEAIHVARQLFINLGQIAPVFIIMGNHDCNLANRKRMDALSPILDPVNHKTDKVYIIENVHYLRDSGFYQYHNIVFGVTSVTGSRLIQAKHLDEKIWDRMKQKRKYRIALYHGPVHGSKTDVGYRMNRKELLAEHFEGYDFTMLGDIHRFQFLDEQKTVAYSGSLIQQTHGETIQHHGYIHWDLQKAVGKHIEVPNSYGFCTVRILNGSCVHDENAESIPKKPRLRFILENTNQIQYREILTEFEAKYQIQETIVDVQTALLRSKNLLEKKVSKKTSLDPNAIVKVYLDKKNLETEMKESILTLHEQIYQNVCKTNVKKIKVRTTKSIEWRLMELKFSNTLSYGPDNVIDFRRYRNNTIIGLFAPNFYGKSALIDIILFCLFEKLSRGDRRDVLNTNKNKFSCSLVFGVGSKVYRIVRTGKKNPNSPIVKVEVEFSLINSKTGKILTNLNGLDKNDTNKKIVDIVGDYNDYLTTCFFLQNSSNDFMDMTQLQRKEYLHSILKLNVFESCHVHAKNHHKEITGQLKLLESQIEKYSSFDELKEKIKTLQEQIDKQIKQRDRTVTSASAIVQYIIDTYKKSNLPIYSELAKYELKTGSDIEAAIQDIKQKIEKIDGSNLDELVGAHQKSLESLESHHKFREELDLRSKIDELIDQKVKLMEKIQNITSIKYSPDKLNSRIAEKNEALLKIRDSIRNLEESNRGVTLDGEGTDIQMKNINHDIRNFQNRIKNVASNPISIEDVSKKLNETETKLTMKLKENVDHVGVVLDEKTRTILETKISVYEKFKKHVTHLKNLIEKIVLETGIDIGESLHPEINWIESYDNFIQRSKKILETDNDEITELRKRCTKIRQEFYRALEQHRIIEQNEYLEKKIKEKRRELDALSTIGINQKKLENLIQEASILEKQIQIDKESLGHHDQNLKMLESNKLIEKQIEIVEKDISKHKSNDISLRKKEKDMLHTLEQCKNKLASHKKRLAECSDLKKHLSLLKQYQHEYTMWMRQNDIVKKWEEEKRSLDGEVHKLNQSIDSKKLELHDLKSELKTYIGLRKEYDTKCSEVQLYQSYIQIMHHNGLPYEMLKVYLPIIESDVNQILHSIVTFSVSFIFASDDAERPEIKSKSSVNRLDIFICHVNESGGENKAYNAMLGSGFEKFIIGIALRVTLGKLSLTSKPNFMVIDEGWTCLDPDNLSNVEPMINYLKSQYDHIILISHADDLKSQADYILNISKERGYSYLNNSQSLKTLSITEETESDAHDSILESPVEIKRTNSDQALIKKKTKPVSRSKSKS